MHQALYLVFGFMSVMASSVAQAQIQTVPFVDVGRYVGRWYQMARIPLPFEPESCPCAQQTLNVRADGNLGIYNSCNRNTVNGPLAEISGYGVNDDPKTNARYTVDFNVGRKGKYWIIALDSEYRYAAVTDEWSYSLYILSKTPTLAPELYRKAVEEAAKQVSTTSRLRITSHEGCTYPAL